jgi:F-type H+-transporting ATPase subunit b
MLLEINPLVLPDIGLVFWNTVAFLVLAIVLGKFAWKPMLKAISDREKGIQDALNQADKVKSEMAAMQNENEALLAKAREERAMLISDAKATADKMVSEAKEKAKQEYDKIVADAQMAITHQKNAAISEVKNQVGALVVEVAEKVLRRELSDKTAQEKYIKELSDAVKLN